MVAVLHPHLIINNLLLGYILDTSRCGLIALDTCPSALALIQFGLLFCSMQTRIKIHSTHSSLV